MINGNQGHVKIADLLQQVVHRRLVGLETEEQDFFLLHLGKIQVE